MTSLYNKTILIGRDGITGSLLVSVGGNKATAISAQHSVPQTVSRCQPARGIAHACIAIDNHGTMTLTNMKEENTTFVNGRQIVTKQISPKDKVELGNDHFNIDIAKILEAAKNLTGTTGPDITPVNISHLKKIWDDYTQKKKEIIARQKKINLIRSGCGIFTLCAMPCIYLFGKVGYALTGIGIIGNIYCFVGLKNDNTSDVIEKLNDKLMDDYVCPKCKKFLGFNKYKYIKKQYSNHCPFCKVEFIEN